MTEDDTFLKLKQIPYHELMKILTPAIGETHVYNKYTPADIAFLRTHGWTELKFKKAYAARIVDLQDFSWYSKIMNHIVDLENMERKPV